MQVGRLCHLMLVPCDLHWQLVAHIIGGVRRHTLQLNLLTVVYGLEQLGERLSLRLMRFKVVIIV